MKLGIFDLSYEEYAKKGLSSCDMVDMAKEQGFSAFEPYPYKDLQSVDSAKKLGKKAAENNIEITCFSTDVDLLGPNAKAEVERMKLYIEMAAAMGSPFFHHTIHPQLEFTGLSLAEALDEVAPRLKELCRYATERGVTCLYEEQGMLFNGVEPCEVLASKMSGENFGFCLDAGNIYFVDERPTEFVKALGPYIKHVHLKDYYVKTGPQDPGEGWYQSKGGTYLRDAIVGHGDVDYIYLMQLIKKSGYKGAFSLEYCGEEDHSYAIPQSVENIKKYYENA